MTADARMTEAAHAACVATLAMEQPPWADAIERKLRAHDAALRAELDCLRAAATLVLPADLNAEPGPYVHVRKEDLACLRTALTQLPVKAATSTP